MKKWIHTTRQLFDRRLGAMAVAGIAVTLAGCSTAKPVSVAAAAAKTAREAPIRIGIAPNYPPLAFKQDGQLKGIEAEMAERIAAEIGRSTTIVETPWEQLIPSLQAGSIDVIMSGLSITDERQRVVDFTAPYMNVGQMALFRIADKDRGSQPDAMNRKGAKVGFGNRTTGEQYARSTLKRAQLSGFDSVPDGVAALRAKKIDYFIYDAPAVWRITGGFDSPERELTSLFLPLTTEQLAWAVHKGNDPLRTELNAALARWRANGTLNTVLGHWIRVRKQAIFVEPPPR